MNIAAKNINIQDYTYDLPDEKIARYPLAERDKSKLLVYQNGQISETQYAYIADQLPENTLLVFNNTKVVAARLLFQKITGTTVEIFCLEPAESYPDITSAMMQRNAVTWKCLVGGAKKWKEGILQKELLHEGERIVFSADKKEKHNDYFLVEFRWSGGHSFAEILSIYGNIPLPPYLNRMVEEEDKQRYQTVYAAYEGSVAAPTAGLHFTHKLLEQLNNKGIAQAYVTLHVGAGTFRPVKSATMENHDMHAEFFEVSKELIRRLANEEKKIVAVGTTSLRTIESLYWMGVKLLQGKGFTDLAQWECYELPQDIPVTEALKALLAYAQETGADKLIAKTRIIIAPSYKLRVARGVVTNFHQPNSTLLLLVAAVVGDDWRKIYDHALRNNYRFLSYGDGSLLWQQ